MDRSSYYNLGVKLTVEELMEILKGDIELEIAQKKGIDLKNQKLDKTDNDKVDNKIKAVSQEISKYAFITDRKACIYNYIRQYKRIHGG